MLHRPDCPECGEPLTKPYASCRCGWASRKKTNNPHLYGIQCDTATRAGDAQEKYQWTDKQCAWNDHGIRCDKEGHCSQTTSGHGPWYCRDHFAAIMGWSSAFRAQTSKPAGNARLQALYRLIGKIAGQQEEPGELG